MRFYESITANYGIQWGIESGYSVPPLCKLAKLSGLDLSEVGISCGDYKLKELQDQIHKERNLHGICLITQEHLEGPTIVFTPSVFSAQGVAHYLTNNYGIPATYIHGKQDEDERTERLNQFRSGVFQCLVNCQVVATGFDHPPTKTLILARPTRSRSFWLQCVGRATRPLPGVVDTLGITADERKKRIAASDKPYFKIIDCTDASLDHRLVTAPDMFCDLSPEESKHAKDIAGKAEKPLTPEELEALAKEAAAKEAERKAAAEAIERLRQETRGRASGRLYEQQFDVRGGGRSVGTYTNPLKGKYAGRKLSELPGHYLKWGADNPKLTGWIRQMYRKEIKRRSGK